ncbi:MAG TPA: hypothetical protein ENK18_17100 [Deltaproteobacteria bacterium]|nr:hypothetical protein [Deltaproteobacteria bacterium]
MTFTSPLRISSPLRVFWLSCLAASLPAPAQAGSLGLGLAFVQDLPDPISTDTRLGLGLSLQLPVRLDLTEHTSLRIGGRLDYAGGGGERNGFWCRELDVISWDVIADERAGVHPRCGWMLSGGLTVGPEIRLPVSGPVQPYVAGGLGLTAIGNFHNIHIPELLDPQRNNLSPDGLSFNIDPFSLKASWLTDLALGAHLGERWYAEAGYSSAWAGRAELKKSTADLEVDREPYGWNALRLAGGLRFPL